MIKPPQSEPKNLPDPQGLVSAHAPNSQEAATRKRDGIEAAYTLEKLAREPKTAFKKSIGLQRHIGQPGADSNFAEQWNSLYCRAGNRAIFLSQEWIETWLETYGAHFDSKWIWWSNDGLIVGACLLLTRSISVKAFTLNTLFLNATGVTPERSPLAEFNDVLCVHGFEEEVAVDLAVFLSELKWDRFIVGGYLSGGVIARVIANVRALQVEIESKPAPYIDFQTLADTQFDEQLTSSTCSQIRRCRRIYEDRFGSVTIACADTLETALKYFDHMADLHNARWKKKGVSGSFSNVPAIEFHRRLIAKLWRRRQVELICVKAGEKIVGILYNFIDSGKVYFFQSGFVYEDDNKVKPGLLTHSLVIESYRARGLREYDFLAGDSQYKRSLAKKHRLLHWVTVYRDNGWVRLFVKCKEAGDIFKRIKEYFKAAGTQ